MTQLVDTIVSWPAVMGFVGVTLAYGFLPGFLLRLTLLMYRREDPRRRELVAELYSIPPLRRPVWVAQQLETALADGLLPRVGAYVTRSRVRIMSMSLPAAVAIYGGYLVLYWYWVLARWTWVWPDFAIVAALVAASIGCAGHRLTRRRKPQLSTARFRRHAAFFEGMVYGAVALIVSTQGMWTIYYAESLARWPVPISPEAIGLVLVTMGIVGLGIGLWLTIRASRAEPPAASPPLEPVA